MGARAKEGLGFVRSLIQADHRLEFINGFGEAVCTTAPRQTVLRNHHRRQAENRKETVPKKIMIRRESERERETDRDEELKLSETNGSMFAKQMDFD